LATRIGSYPFVFGILLAFVLAGALLAVQVWLPWFGEYWERHKLLGQGIYFSFFFFVVAVGSVWSWRRRRGFWLSTCGFFLIHIVAVFLYTNYVRAILVWQWAIVLFCEGWVFAIVLVLSTRHVGRHAQHQRGR